MIWEASLVAYGHYVSFMVAFAALVVEVLTLKKELSVNEAWKIAIADGIYGISATLILVTGTLRVLYFGKGLDYYLTNGVFYVKIGIFFGIGFLSLYPTITFLGWIKNLQQQKPPTLDPPKLTRLSWLIRAELLGFLSLPLWAAMLARGLGH